MSDNPGEIEATFGHFESYVYGSNPPPKKTGNYYFPHFSTSSHVVLLFSRSQHFGTAHAQCALHRTHAHWMLIGACDADWMIGSRGVVFLFFWGGVYVFRPLVHAENWRAAKTLVLGMLAAPDLVYGRRFDVVLWFEGEK